MVLIFETKRKTSWRDKLLPVTSVTVDGKTRMTSQVTISEPTEIFETKVTYRSLVGGWAERITWSMERHDPDPNREPF